jgi:plastocyanin
MIHGTGALAALVAPLALAACGGGPAYGPPPGDGAVAVAMTNVFSFAPETLRVPVGTTVEWRNRSIAKHDVTAEPALSKEVSLPKGAVPFASGDIPPGGVYRTTFFVPGAYRYTCLRHEDVFGMTGTVEVMPATPVARVGGTVEGG